MKFLSLNNELTKQITAGPHGWIQFKGTDLCIDIHCKCGAMTHFDGGFCYFIKCVVCGQVYELNGHIELIERKKDEVTDYQESTDY